MVCAVVEERLTASRWGGNVCCESRVRGDGWALMRWGEEAVACGSAHVDEPEGVSRVDEDVAKVEVAVHMADEGPPLCKPRLW